MKGRPFERENEGIDDDDDHELFAVAEVLVVVGRRRDDNDAANPLREEIMRGVDIIRFIIEISTGVLDRNRSRLFVAQASNILWRDEGVYAYAAMRRYLLCLPSCYDVHLQ